MQQMFLMSFAMKELGFIALSKQCFLLDYKRNLSLIVESNIFSSDRFDFYKLVTNQGESKVLKLYSENLSKYECIKKVSNHLVYVMDKGYLEKIASIYKEALKYKYL